MAKDKNPPSLGERFWERYFEVYDVLNYLIPYTDLLYQLVEEMKPKRGELILDAGAGTGNLAVLLERLGAEVIALDFSQKALNVYRRKSQKAKPILADLNHPLPFKDKTFDHIVSNNVLYNIPKNKRLRVMLEFKRVLRPGGKLVLSNIHKRFSPIRIYKEGFYQALRRKGFLFTLSLSLKLFVPTVKMFYYNLQIQKAHQLDSCNLFETHEQRLLLEEAGFKNISETRLVYADQAVMNTGVRP